MNDQDALHAFETGKGRTSRRRGILFVERCLKFLKPGGRLAIVLDDSVLNLEKNGDIQALMRQQAIIEAVVSLPDVTFMPYSTAKSSILVLRRRHSPDEKQGLVFMADVENVGNRPNGDPLYTDEPNELGHRILKSDLPKVLELYQHSICGERQEAMFEGTTVFNADINAYDGSSRLDVFYYHPARRVAQERLANANYPLASLGDIVEIDSSAVMPAVEYADSNVRWIGLGDIESLTGHYEVRDVPGDRIKSNAHMFRSGDVLFSRLRPKLRKSVLIPDDDEGGICSSELLVLRIRPMFAGQVSRAYLAYLLRSELAYGQLIYQITGVGRPRVSTDAVRRLVIALPPLEIQHRLVDDLAAADRKARHMKSEAIRQLEQSLQEIESAYMSVMTYLFSGDSRGVISSSVGVASTVSAAARATA